MSDPIRTHQRTSYGPDAERQFRLEQGRMNGESAAATKQRHTDQTLAAGVTGLAMSAVNENLGNLAQAVGGMAGGVAFAVSSIGSTLAGLLEGYAGSMVESGELNEAHRRDSYQQSVTLLASGALPADFAQHQIRENGGVGDSAAVGQDAASRFITRLAAAGKLEEAKRQAEALADSGTKTASQLGLRSEAGLKAALERDANFAHAYHDSSFAFRLGVDSVIYQAHVAPRPEGPKS